MQIRYSKLYSGLTTSMGAILVLINLGLLGYGSDSVTGLAPGIILLVIGGLSWGRAYALIENGEFAVQNFLGMKFRKTPVERLFVEPVGRKRRLFRLKDNGKRQRLLTMPSWVFDNDDADRFFNSVSSAGVFD